MNWKDGITHTGISAAFGAALLFGAGTPLAKLLLTTVNPWLLAGLLYLGSGVGLMIYRRLMRAPAVSLTILALTIRERCNPSLLKLASALSMILNRVACVRFPTQHGDPRAILL